MPQVDGIRGHIDQRVAAGHKRVVRDLRDVTFMDSTGLLVLETDASAGGAQWEPRLIERPARVQWVFELAGIRDALLFVKAPPTPYPNPAPERSSSTRRCPPDLKSLAADHAHPWSSHLATVPRTRRKAHRH